MPNSLRLSGFDALRAELSALPQQARTDADPILSAAARRAQAAIQSAYPIVTGRLRAGVKVYPRTVQGVTAAYRIVSDAPYARVFEFGGARLPPRATFLPITERERRASVVAVAAAVEGHGLKVTGARD